MRSDKTRPRRSPTLSKVLADLAQCVRDQWDEFEDSCPDQWAAFCQAAKQHREQGSPQSDSAFTKSAEALLNGVRLTFPGPQLRAHFDKLGEEVSGRARKTFNKLLAGIAPAALEGFCVSAFADLVERKRVSRLGDSCHLLAQRCTTFANEFHRLWMRATLEGVSTSLDRKSAGLKDTADELRELASLFDGRRHYKFMGAVDLITFLRQHKQREPVATTARLLGLDRDRLSTELSRFKDPSARRTQVRLYSKVALWPDEVLQRLEAALAQQVRPRRRRAPRTPTLKTIE